MALVEWDARTYHRVAEPQLEWGRRVLARLDLRGDERVIDAGCGTGRLTAELADRLPRGRVLALDRSDNMLAVARSELPGQFGARVMFLRGDLARLPLAEWADVVFSTATFHWVADHPGLFNNVCAVLRPCGRLVAQCGGRGNLAHLHDRAERLGRDPAFAPFFTGWTAPWEFADDHVTARRLALAGFTDVETSLEPAPTFFRDAESFRDFLRCVTLRPHLERLPTDRCEAFLDELVRQFAADDPPFALDYCRLNISAQRDPEGSRR